MGESTLQEIVKFGCGFAFSSAVNAELRYQWQLAGAWACENVRNLPLRGSAGAFCRSPGRLNQ